MNWLQIIKLNMHNKGFILPPYWPTQIQSVWGKIAYTYSWNMYILDKGRGDVLGKFTGLFAEISAFMVVLNYFGYTNLSMGWVLMMGIIGVFAAWVIGWLYQLLGMDKVWILMANHRNVMFTEMYDKLNKKVR